MFLSFNQGNAGHDGMKGPPGLVVRTKSVCLNMLKEKVSSCGKEILILIEF